MLDLLAALEGGCTRSRSSLIIGILKMHAACNNNAAFLAHLNATDVYWDPLGPELQRHQLFRMLRIITYAAPHVGNNTHAVSCSRGEFTVIHNGAETGEGNTDASIRWMKDKSNHYWSSSQGAIK